MRNLILAASLLVSGCSWLAVATAPNKPVSPKTAETQAVSEAFWSALHAGRYDQIDTLIERHMQLINKDPGEPVTLAHVAFLNAWKLTERSRAPVNARVLESATLARRYFEESVRLDPTEARFRGFAAAFAMAEGTVLKSERDTRQGYYQMKEAVAMWPEFNLFTSGYTMSTGPIDSTTFKEALEQQWTTLDLCFGERVSRNQPQLGRYLAMETTVGPKRVCWNSWIAPYNFEGFFMNFGDMLVRAGDKGNAKSMYQAAQSSRTYAAWPYRSVLERRLQSLDSLQQVFLSAKQNEPESVPMFDSAFSCMACHQKTGAISVRN